MKDAKGHGSDARGGTDQSKPITDAGIIRAKGIKAMYGPGSPGYPTKPAMPIPGHDYHSKTNDELQFIQRDASAAAKNMQGMGNDKAEGKYLDQVNDASTVLGYRGRGGEDLSKGPAAGIAAQHGISGPAAAGSRFSGYPTGGFHAINNQTGEVLKSANAKYGDLAPRFETEEKAEAFARKRLGG